jgi:hypothetical protein
MSEYIHKSHDVTVLLYHVVLPAKYRRSVSDDRIDEVLKEVCLEISERYQVKFLEIGTDKDHVHFFGAICADVQRDEDSGDAQEPDGTRDIQAMSAGEENIVGWRILDRWILCEHDRQTRRRTDDRSLRQESREGKQQAAFKPSARTVLRYPAACGGVVHFPAFE